MVHFHGSRRFGLRRPCPLRGPCPRLRSVSGRVSRDSAERCPAAQKKDLTVRWHFSPLWSGKGWPPRRLARGHHTSSFAEALADASRTADHPKIELKAEVSLWFAHSTVLVGLAEPTPGSLPSVQRTNRRQVSSRHLRSTGGSSRKTVHTFTRHAGKTRPQRFVYCGCWSRTILSEEPNLTASPTEDARGRGAQSFL